MTAQAAAVRPRAHPLIRSHAELLILLALLVLSGIVHGWNMFGYPYFENDEATYLSRGWAFVTEGRLDVHTYRYDHAPLGWIAVGGWLALTGGGAVFGGMLEAGRVLMLLVHLASTGLLYVAATRLAGGRLTAGVIAVLAFSLSPIGVYFHRRVLLDNLMVLWVLLAIVLLLRRPLTLGSTAVSGLVFGIAVLTKLNAVFFGLGFLVLLWFGARGLQRKHALLCWLGAAGGTVLLFFLYALLNQELLPAPIGADGEPLRVSLVDTFGLQLGRGDFAWPWDPASSFLQSVGSWVAKDWYTLAIGSVAGIGLLLLLLVHRFRAPGTLAVVVFLLSYLVFLARGGIVIDLYVVPALPFLAMALGLLGAWLSGLAPGRMRGMAATALAGTLVAGYVVIVDHHHLDVDETGNQEAALAWIEREVPTDAVIVADNYVYPELAQEGDYDGTIYFFSAEYDPESRERYDDDWRDIDYLVLTHEVVEQISQGTVPRVAELLAHSELRASFTEGSSSYLDLPAGISTNGDWAQVYATKSRNGIVLQDSWTRFRDDWIVDYGQVLTAPAGDTTSDDQALAMEQALAEGDEATFRGVWQWTGDHLRHRADDVLASRLWRTQPDGTGALVSADTDCAADQRFIGLLVEAAGAWDDPALVEEAAALAADWWRECTFERGGLRLLDSSADGSVDDQLMNPSTFDPALYRSLAEALPEHDWLRLVDDGYAFLARVLDERGTIPNWVVLDEDDELATAETVIGPGADALGEDTLRLLPALLVDDALGDPRATAIIDALAPSVLAYADAVPGLASGAAETMLAAARDLGLDAEALYREHIAARLDPTTGAFAGGLVEFAWLHAWHRLQDDLPTRSRVALL